MIFGYRWIWFKRNDKKQTSCKKWSNWMVWLVSQSYFWDWEASDIFKKEKIKSHFNSEDKPIRIKPIFEKDFFEFNCNGDRNEGLLLEEYLKKRLRRKYEKYWFCLYVDRSYCKCLKTSLNLYESYMAKKNKKATINCIY